MLTSLSRVVKKTDDYNTCDFCSDCSERCYCCVVDPNDREDRCCAFSVLNSDTVDLCFTGNLHEVEMMNESELAKYKILRVAQIVLVISIILFFVLGFFAVVRPDIIVFNHVADDVTTQRLTEGNMWLAKAEEEKKKLDEKASVDTPAVSQFMNKVFNLPDVTIEERKKVEEFFRLASERLDGSRGETAVVLAPVVMYGGSNIFYAIVCLYVLLYPPKFGESIAHLHLFWYVTNCISYIYTMSMHGQNMQSGNLVFFMIALCFAGAIAWFTLMWKITRVLLQDKRKEGPK